MRFRLSVFRLFLSSHNVVLVQMEVPVPSCCLFLPSDLLPCIVETSYRPILTYMQLLGLSHGIRLAIWGTPRELSFTFNDGREPDLAAPTPTVDALAALIGPCKNLVKLSFSPSGSPFCPNVFGCGCNEAASTGWVDETFGGHDRLTVLEYLPTTFEPSIERILFCLPGLLELHLGSKICLSTHLLSAITHSCPHLQVLRGSLDEDFPRVEHTALAPLAGSLQQLRLRGGLEMSNLEAFVRLSAIGTLNLSSRCPPAVLKPLVSHLTRLSVEIADDDEQSLPGPWLSHLEHLSLRSCRVSFSAPVTQLLTANQTTLRCLKMSFLCPEVNGLARVLASLDSLIQLTRLELICHELSRSGDITALPLGLLGRLEHLTLGLVTSQEPFGLRPFGIASGRLQCLRLGELGFAMPALTVDCPALVELRLPRAHIDQLIFKSPCPGLRLIDQLPVQFDCPSAPMPALESLSAGRQDPVWLPGLLAQSPRLRSLPGVELTRPDLLAGLCACQSLVDMCLGLNGVQLPNPLVLRLPERLEALELSLGNGLVAPPFDLQLEAPRLRRLDIDLAVRLRCRLRCPALTTLGIRLKGCDIPLLELDERAPLRSLAISGGNGAVLLGLLTRQGTRLHHVKLRPAVGASDWTQLAAALGRLPRLASLELDICNAPPPLSLACPQLRTLNLVGTKDAKVVLACPLLEALCALCIRQVELALPAPNLPPIHLCLH
ncbi:hypothetical protein PAPYR_3941 [Paratrimastix pyriformis]|uniref:Uncharacterized protein n=1 Tax=Paratrimastix pyriformis TaxID=342808 RepID=A0ABQ8UT13_9EUKA|nr:hypothetical protein PAPYR_3941 [Paratrimastix pyriformis]